MRLSFTHDAGEDDLHFRWRTLFCAALGIVLFCLVAPLLPFQDDWTYLTAPSPDFTWRDLLPGTSFWRPFDALWGGLLGLAPWMFPWANRIMIAVGHVLCVWIAMCLIDILCKDRRGRIAAYGFFAVSSGIAAVIVNTDSLNIVWSSVWGCLGTLALLKGQNTVLVFACYVFSLLCKESGVSWLAIGPILVYAKDSDWRRFLKLAGVGACIFVAYLCLRFALRGDIVLGGDGNYALTRSPKIVGRNFMILVGMSLSNVDGLAMFAHPCVFYVTVILSCLAWLAFVRSVRIGGGRDAARYLWVCAGVIIAFAAPHCLFKNHHPAEMHFYPVLLGGAFVIAITPLDKIRRVPFGIAVAAMGIVFALGWYDKLTTIYATSARVERLMADIKGEVPDFNRPFEYVVKSDEDLVRYSVFSQSPAWCLDYGRALRCLNGWRESKIVIIEERQRDEGKL